MLLLMMMMTSDTLVSKQRSTLLSQWFYWCCSKCFGACWLSSSSSSPKSDASPRTVNVNSTAITTTAQHGLRTTHYSDESWNKITVYYRDKLCADCGRDRGKKSTVVVEQDLASDCGDEDEVLSVTMDRSNPHRSSSSYSTKPNTMTPRSCSQTSSPIVAISSKAIDLTCSSPPLSPFSLSGGSTLSRSPSNYCRVATCEQLHIHELTPKCLETFAPSSTCSSCQTCARKHIGPNHDQVLMFEQLLKRLELPLGGDQCTMSGHDTSETDRKHHHHQSSHSAPSTKCTSVLMQWPLPEYRPQHSPDHLYRSIGC